MFLLDSEYVEGFTTLNIATLLTLLEYTPLIMSTIRRLNYYVYVRATLFIRVHGLYAYIAFCNLKHFEYNIPELGQEINCI